MKYGNVFYFYKLNEIGGIETFFFNLAKKYADRDITIFYRVGAYQQVKRLRKYVRTIQWTGQNIECKRAFFCFNLDIIDYVQADEYYQIMHGDYRAMDILPNRSPKIQKYLAVSKTAAEAFTEITGEPTKCVYNPISEPPQVRALHLVTASRLSKDKGRSRMELLANTLDAAKVPYTWEVFTDDTKPIPSPNVVFRKPTMNIQPFIAAADWLVQLSDNEGYGYSVVEALQAGTPVIVTPCPVFKELGVKDGENAIVLPFDFTTVPLKTITAGLKPFEYKPKRDGWSALLGKEPSTYVYEEKDKFTTAAAINYFDMVLNRRVTRGEMLEMERERAEYLENRGLVRIID